MYAGAPHAGSHCGEHLEATDLFGEDVIRETGR
jgi:hypothetical protein